MKKQLLSLVEDIPKIESKFRHCTPSRGLLIPECDLIYDNPEFISWLELAKYVLQDIYNRTKDEYVWKIINATGIINKFNGKSGDEREMFNQLKSALYIIVKNADKYYPNSNEEGDISMKKPMLFISHASDDIKYVRPLVELFADIGLNNSTMFCSSVPDYAIPLNQDIYSYLASLFSSYNIYVIFVLSNNYYNSVACLNEMGAAWVLKNEYTTILLPEFEYKEIKGAVNPNKIGMKFNDEDELIKKRLGELKNIISEKFGISVPDMRWENKRNDFLEIIRKIS